MQSKQNRAFGPWPDLLLCRRPADCRCNRPLEVVLPCPRAQGCLCRWTWRDTSWEKGDAHTRCPIHHGDHIVIDEPDDPSALEDHPCRE